MQKNNSAKFNSRQSFNNKNKYMKKTNSVNQDSPKIFGSLKQKQAKQSAKKLDSMLLKENSFSPSTEKESVEVTPAKSNFGESES